MTPLDCAAVMNWLVKEHRFDVKHPDQWVAVIHGGAAAAPEASVDNDDDRIVKEREVIRSSEDSVSILWKPV